MDRDEYDNAVLSLELRGKNTFLKEIRKVFGHTSRTSAMEVTEVREGAILEGKVAKISHFGAFINLPEGKLGLVHISEIADEYVKNIEDFLTIGKIVKVKVIRVNAQENKIDLSLKQVSTTTEPHNLIVGAKSETYNKDNVPQRVPFQEGQKQHKKNLSKSTVEKIETASKVSSQPLDIDKFGRVKNAEQCPFRFVPHTVIRPVADKYDENTDGNKNSNIPKNDTAKLMQIVNLMSAGSISSFETSLLYWIARLRFSNKAMLTDLMSGGFIDRTRLTQTNLEKLMKNKLDLLFKNDLIHRVQFVSLDESGQNVLSKGSHLYILNKIGGTTLKEIGMTDVRYDAFDIVQDGNTVKKIMAVNQWLIFMLTHFPKKAIGENFETSNIFHLMADEHSSARFFGTVICNGKTLVGEAVRRVENFELRFHRNSLREKCERFIKIFSKFTEIYIKRNNGGRDKFIITDRPILIYICEDDSHINEVYEMLRDIIERNPSQEIWFTTDLRIFNAEMVNHRFLIKEHHQQNILVDLKKRLNVQELSVSELA